MDRRAFVAGLAGYWTLDRSPPRPPVALPRVEAETSVFYAAPDGQRVLVRFRVHGAEAPAGRLRVYDSSRTLLGTAGVLATGSGHLYGELFVPLTRDRRLVSELSLPQARPLWSFHALEPGPRWVVHVLAIVEPAALLRRLTGLPPMLRAVETATLQALPIRGNPADVEAPALLDHLPLLTMGSTARHLEEAFGIRMSPVAVGDGRRFAGSTVPLALNGSGTRHAVVTGGEAIPLRSPDGSTLAVPPAGLVGDLRTLHMATGGDLMARAVERWLQSLSLPDGPRAPAPGVREVSAFAMGDSADEISLLALRTAEEWNARYAFPRIVLDGTPPPPERFGALSGSGTGADAAAAPPWAPRAVSENDLGAGVQARLRERTRRTAAMIASLADAMRIADRTLEGVGSRLTTQSAGTVVFNPTPFTRSDLVRFPDGTDRLVTDVPGNGYAFMPEIPGEAVTWRPAGPAWSADGAMLRVELDRDSGAIRSLVGRADGTEWVQASPGFNALPGARVERCEGAALPGVATRLVADRRMASGATLRSTVTAYHRLPWVDVWNEILPPASPLLDIRFALATPATSVEWEIPAGSLESGVPAEFTWLRWLRLSSDTGSLMIGGLEAPVATVNGDGLLVTKPAGPTAAFRLAVQPRGQDRWREDPWRHGWSMEPLLSAPVTGAGRITLPSFGSLLTTSDPGAVIIGMEPDDDFTLVVYLQELLGLSRTVAVRSAVMRFREARLADLVGRDRAPLDARDGEVRLELRAHGVTAIRLRQVTTSSA